MRAYYNITTKLRDAIKEGLINTVTEGDISKVDLNKQQIYPLAHVAIESAGIAENAITFQVAIIFADIVDYSPTNAKDSTDPYHGNDNSQDVLNSMLAEANILTQKMIRGGLFENYIQVSEATAEPFYERFANNLAGWALTFTVTMPNNEICV